MRKFFIPILLMLVFSIGCKKESKKEDAVYRIGKRYYTLDQILSEMDVSPVQFNALPEEHQKYYLDMWLSNELLYLEALDKGIDKDPQFKKKLEYLKKQLLVNALFQEIMQNTGFVSDEEVNRFYQEHIEDYSTERKIAHISLPTEDMAREVLNKLNNGESFAKLARTYSIDTTTARSGGVMGWFTRGDFSNIPEFEDSIFALEKVGDISGVVPSPYGYDIIKLLGKRRLRKPRSFQDVSVGIRNRLTLEKRRAVLDSLLTELKKKFDVEEMGRKG